MIFSWFFRVFKSNKYLACRNFSTRLLIEIFPKIDFVWKRISHSFKLGFKTILTTFYRDSQHHEKEIFRRLIARKMTIFQEGGKLSRYESSLRRSQSRFQNNMALASVKGWLRSFYLSEDTDWFRLTQLKIISFML